MFWQFVKKPYLCIRFQGATLLKHIKKEFFEKIT